MVDDRPEDIELSPDPGRAKRAPPTIDLDASEVSGETRQAAAGAAPPPESPPPSAEADSEPAPSMQAPAANTISPWIVAPVSGAVAAALVIGVGWMLGWPAVRPASQAAPQVTAQAIDDLSAKIAGLESKISKPADPAIAARIDTLEKSTNAQRAQLALAVAQAEAAAKAAADLNAAKSAPGATASAPDLSAIQERLSQLENATRTQGSEIAQESAKPSDDKPLRLTVAGALLDVLVRVGDPYSTALAAAKALAPNPDALKPLDTFATSGVPTPAALSRELLTLVPKLSPPAPDNATTGTGLIDRLQAGAAKLVRIERTDAVGTDAGAIVARVTAAALRNDFVEARRELNTLTPAERAAAQPWIDKADARDAALAVSRQFAADAMAALAKPAP
jgi:hypothetical protein